VRFLVTKMNGGDFPGAFIVPAVRPPGQGETHCPVCYPFPGLSPGCWLILVCLTQLALPLRQSFNRLCVAQNSFHSLAQACASRRMNRSQPRAVLIYPNTGSTVCRANSEPSFVSPLLINSGNLESKWTV